MSRERNPKHCKQPQPNKRERVREAFLWDGWRCTEKGGMDSKKEMEGGMKERKKESVTKRERKGGVRQK